jgi:AAA+ superfamily predicted ATPase
MATKEPKTQVNTKTLAREIEMPAHIVNLLKAMGMALPPNVKEIDSEVEFSEETKKILVPKGMDKLKAASELEKMHYDEEQLINIDADFDGWNWKDVLVAIKLVTEEAFGWMNAQNVYSFFGIQRPTEIDVVVDVQNGKHQIQKAFYGKFRISYWEDADSYISVQNGTVKMNIEAKRKYSEEISKYYNLIREHLETQSIFRGKSIMVTKKDVLGSKQLDFEIIENKGSNDIILNRKEEVTVDQFIIGSLDDSGKRCYLFTGKYGTGKTETAMRVGREAVARGMAFFYVKDATIFDELLHQSKKYQPCLIFLEDIDEITAGAQRDADMNKILNTLDGVQTKGNNLTTIFTTNHPERINSALRRPGRIDIVVNFAHPEKDTVAKIYERLLAGMRGAEKLDYAMLAEQTPDVAGAVIAEIATRVKKLAKKQPLSDELVLACIASMEYQIQLMQDKVAVEDERITLVKLLHQFVGGATWQVPEVVDARQKIDKIQKAVGA